MIRKLWIAGWVAELLLILGFLTVAISGIILQNNAKGGIDEPLLGLAGLSGVMAAVGMVAMSIWTSELGGTPERSPRLPRAMRQELKKREAQMQFNKLVADLEYENEIKTDV